MQPPLIVRHGNDVCRGIRYVYARTRTNPRIEQVSSLTYLDIPDLYMQEHTWSYSKVEMRVYSQCIYPLY